MKWNPLISYCYIGPTILGLAQSRILLNGNEANLLEESLKKRGYESAVKLIVPCQELSKALNDLENGKGLLSHCFKEVARKNKEKNL